MEPSAMAQLAVEVLLHISHSSEQLFSRIMNFFHPESDTSEEEEDEQLSQDEGIESGSDTVDGDADYEL